MRVTAEPNAPPLWAGLLRWPGPQTHKHNRGRLGVISGGLTSTGAARLAARAGLRAGAGLVRVLAPPEAIPALAPALEAIMLSSFENIETLEALARPLDAIVIGPAAGLDARTRANLTALSRTGAALVVDADALSVFEGEAAALYAVLDQDDVLTPHEGEFERLFPGLLAAEGRERAVCSAAEQANATVVLKGHDSLIASPAGGLRVNRGGSPWLATAGTGDVLAGLIGGLLAQGVPGFDAASAAVWMHARAADSFGPGLTAEDLPDLLPGVLRQLHEKRW